MRTVPLVAAVVADLVAVLVFTMIGRASHREGDAALGMLAVAWPFAVGALVGHVVARMLARTDEPASLRRGALVVIGTVVVGMALRAASGRGIETAFLLVTTITLAVLMLGWRAVTIAVRRRAAARPDAG